MDIDITGIKGSTIERKTYTHQFNPVLFLSYKLKNLLKYFLNTKDIF